VAVIWLPETTRKLLAGLVLNVTALAFWNAEPVMVTLVPGEPLVGVKLLIVGGFGVWLLAEVWAEKAGETSASAAMARISVRARRGGGWIMRLFGTIGRCATESRSCRSGFARCMCGRLRRDGRRGCSGCTWRPVDELSL
jgi:hypothetical protein